MNEIEKVAAPINREAVKVLAQAVGVREAARRMGLSEERVMKWSQRDRGGPWMTQPGAATIAAPSVTGATRQMSACPQPVRTASEALAEANADNSRRSRSAALRYSARTLEHAADLDGETALASASDVASAVKVASVAGGWSDSDKSKVRVNIFAGQGSAVQVVDNTDSIT